MECELTLVLCEQYHYHSMSMMTAFTISSAKTMYVLIHNSSTYNDGEYVVNIKENLDTNQQQYT